MILDFNCSWNLVAPEIWVRSCSGLSLTWVRLSLPFLGGLEPVLGDFSLVFGRLVVVAIFDFLMPRIRLLTKFAFDTYDMTGSESWFEQTGSEYWTQLHSSWALVQLPGNCLVDLARQL